jgi:hypothetical protein
VRENAGVSLEALRPLWREFDVKRAWLFVGPGVEVGDEAVAAAGSVVTRNVPANAVVAGNPASERGVRWKRGEV